MHFYFWECDLILIRFEFFCSSEKYIWIVFVRKEDNDFSITTHVNWKKEASRTYYLFSFIFNTSLNKRKSYMKQGQWHSKFVVAYACDHDEMWFQQGTCAIEVHTKNTSLLWYCSAVNSTLTCPFKTTFTRICYKLFFFQSLMVSCQWKIYFKQKV